MSDTTVDMPCPMCGRGENRILETRLTTYLGFHAKRRRRECLNCKHRWPTREISESDLSRISGDRGSQLAYLRSLKTLKQFIDQQLIDLGEATDLTKD